MNSPAGIKTISSLTPLPRSTEVSFCLSLGTGFKAGNGEMSELLFGGEQPLSSPAASSLKL